MQSRKVSDICINEVLAINYIQSDEPVLDNEFKIQLNILFHLWHYKSIVTLIALLYSLFSVYENMNIITIIYFLVSVYNFVYCYRFYLSRKNEDKNMFNKNVCSSFTFLVFYWVFGWVIYSRELQHLYNNAFGLYILLMFYQWSVVLLYTLIFIVNIYYKIYEKVYSNNLTKEIILRIDLPYYFYLYTKEIIYQEEEINL